MKTARCLTNAVIGLALAGSVACSNSPAQWAGETADATGSGAGTGGHDAGSVGADGSGGVDSSAGQGGFDLQTGGQGMPDSDSGEDVSAPACGQTAVEKTTKIANVLLVIDESASMVNPNKPAGFTVTKWDALQTSLATALNQVKGGLNFGLELFPYDPSDAGSNACTMPADGAAAVQVPIGPGSTAVAMITDLLSRASPSGGTPTAIALERALDYFKNGHGASVVGDKYVLLATDGAPNCNTAPCEAAECTENIEGRCDIKIAPNCCQGFNDMCLDRAGTASALSALRAQGIKTFIVGIPGTEAYQTQLDAFAEAGGMPASTASPKYYRVDATPDGGDGVGRLTEVFTRITQQLITNCRQQLTSTPPDLNKLNVTVDGVVIPRAAVSGLEGGAAGVVEGGNGAAAEAGATGAGWTLDKTTTPPTIVLQGTVCGKIEVEGATSVQVLYGCPTVTVR